MPVIVVMGASGVGKTTVARALGEQLGWEVADADDLHSAEAITWMAAGQPLSDEQRRPWLDRVAAWIRTHLSADRPGVIACSSLKRAHRDGLRSDGVTFVHLVAPRSVIEARMVLRESHFMPAELLSSQLEALEAPGPDEAAVTVDADAEVAVVVAEVLRRLPSLQRRMAR